MAHTVLPEALTESLPSQPAATLRKPLVLVVDPDESTRSVLEVALTRDGFAVWSASASPAALTLLQGRLPDVIVLETDLGGDDGFTFIARLRGDDRLAKVPVLLLAKADDQNVEALADVVGADDFIQKPAYARDVASMVRVELARREQGTNQPLRFEHKVLPATQLLRALMSCPRSGRMLLAGGRAEIRFRAGKIIDARFEGRGGNLETVVRALALTSGVYEVALEAVDGFAELQCSLRELIELVLPRLQKWTSVLARSLPLDSRLTVDFARLATGLKAMPDEVNRIVQLFDGFRSVEQVLLDSTFNETLTLEVATRLYLMGVLAPVKGTEDAFVVLRPMPRLFEPRASEAEELMQQLFAGTAEIRAESSNTDDADWVTQPGTGLEMTDPNGGWTTAPMPQMLAEGLSPELARQLDAFQTPMRVEAPAIAPEVVAAQKFADREPQLSADTVMETALMNAADDSESVAALEAQLNESLAPDALDELAAAHLAQARGRQARIETPWMTPVVHVPVEQTVTASVSTVEVIASMYEPVTDRTVTPILTPAVAAVGMPAQLRIQTPVLTKAVDPAQAFFESEEPSAMLSLENPMPARTTRRVWPFAVVALAIVALALGFEMLREPAPVVEAPRPTVVVAPVLPDIEPPEFIETDEPVALIDVNENLDEARKLYEAGQYKKALSVLEQVVSDEPKSVLAWNLIGLARYDSLDPVGARAAADKVLELDPKNGRVQILLATMYFDANDKVNGRAALEKYLELEPNGASVDEAKALLKRY